MSRGNILGLRNNTCYKKAINNCTIILHYRNEYNYLVSMGNQKTNK